ncbi:isochorismatase family protein [Bacillus sp. JJ1533]|uniref:isochorismatase family protein n=1 Tax=Bacillus sp. JJ1533 TaxID=3122959 RepID=UPI002FFF4713
MRKEHFNGFGKPSGMGSKPVIIVVDFMKGFTSVECALGSDLDNEVNATKGLLDIARGNKIPVIFTTVCYEPHFKDGAYFVEKVPALKVLTQGSKWTEIDERLGRRENEEPLIVKKFASSFFGTNLASILASENVDTTIITGCTTSGCVRATAVDALQHGYRVVIPEECVGDRSQSAHEANLYDIQTKYGDVVSIESVKNYLINVRGDMSHV